MRSLSLNLKPGVRVVQNKIYSDYIPNAFLKTSLTNRSQFKQFKHMKQITKCAIWFFSEKNRVMTRRAKRKNDPHTLSVLSPRWRTPVEHFRQVRHGHLWFSGWVLREDTSWGDARQLSLRWRTTSSRPIKCESRRTRVHRDWEWRPPVACLCYC